jgi:peptide-methionine (R)-S-oxide reductase
LKPDQYAVLRQSATERPFSSPLLNEHRAGVFGCVGCDRGLFSSETKFDSDTGWPSF